jgi:hypothetical protein
MQGLKKILNLNFVNYFFTNIKYMFFYTDKQVIFKKIIFKKFVLVFEDCRSSEY